MCLRKNSDAIFWEALFVLPGLESEWTRIPGETGGGSGWPGTTDIHEVAKGSCNRKVAEGPAAAAAGMTEANFVEGRGRIESGGQTLGLIGFVCARAKVGI